MCMCVCMYVCVVVLLLDVIACNIISVINIIYMYYSCNTIIMYNHCLFNCILCVYVLAIIFVYDDAEQKIIYWRTKGHPSPFFIVLR